MPCRTNQVAHHSTSTYEAVGETVCSLVTAVMQAAEKCITGYCTPALLQQYNNMHTMKYAIAPYYARTALAKRNGRYSSHCPQYSIQHCCMSMLLCVMLTCGSKSSPVLLLFTPTTQRLSGPSNDTYSDCSSSRCVQKNIVSDSSSNSARQSSAHCTQCVTQSANMSSCCWHCAALQLRVQAAIACDSNEAQRNLKPELKCTRYHMLHSIHHCMTQCLCTGCYSP
jgi:hypothetical protein